MCLGVGCEHCCPPIEVGTDVCVGHKPPIGLRPQFIVWRARVDEILEAMARYSKASIAFPQEWVEELDELNMRLSERKSA